MCLLIDTDLARERPHPHIHDAGTRDHTAVCTSVSERNSHHKPTGLPRRCVIVSTLDRPAGWCRVSRNELVHTRAELESLDWHLTLTLG